MREKQGWIRLEKKFSTGKWMNSLWKVSEFALEIGCNMHWKLDEFAVGIFLKGG